jgi:hypothetical protein
MSNEEHSTHHLPLWIFETSFVNTGEGGHEDSNPETVRWAKASERFQAVMAVMKMDGKSIPEFSSTDLQQFEQATLSLLCNYHIEPFEARSLQPIFWRPKVVSTSLREKMRLFRNAKIT